MPVQDFKFIQCTFSQAGDKNFPDAAISQATHRMTATIPLVEIADHADTLGIGRPGGEDDAVDTVDTKE